MMKKWQRNLMRNATNAVLQALVAKLVYRIFAEKNEGKRKK